MKYILKSLLIFFLLSTYSYSFDGTYIAKICTTPSCKGTGMSDLATGIITGIFGQTPPIILVTKDSNNNTYTINLFSKKKVYRYIDINDDLSFSVAGPESGKGSIEGFFKDTGNNRWIIQFKFENSSIKEYYKGEITPTDTQAKNKIDKFSEMEDFKAERDNLSDELDAVKKDLEKLKKQPIKIDSKNLPNNVTVNSDVNLREKPSTNAKIIRTIKSGTKINNLIELPPSREWALVAVNDGTLGYIKSSFIINAPDSGGAPLQPADMSNDSDLIVITYPKWDSGKTNKQISVNAPGFVSLKGKINSSNVSKFEINGDEVEINNNTFGYVLEVKSGQNRIKTEVFEASGKTTGLEFIIKAP